MAPRFARWLASTNDVTQGFLAAGGLPGLINLGGGLPAPELYPVEDLAEIAARVIRDHPQDCLGYGPVAGLPALRSALAARFAAPDRPLAADNVLITASGLQALDLLGKVLIDEGAEVAVQTPTYLGALDAFRTRMPAYRAVRMDVPDLDPGPLMAGAAFAYTVPNYSNPTGAQVPLALRQGLVAAAVATGTWLIDDDPYGSLFYDAAPLPSLRAFAPPDAPVVQVGTVSKELAPGLRLGWVIGPVRLIRALTMAKQGSDLCTSGLSQRIYLAALEAGLDARVGQAARALYRTRRDALAAAMERHLGHVLTWAVPEGGMFIWARGAVDTDQLALLAREEGVGVSPSSVFDPFGQDRGGLRLNFTLNPPEKLDEAARRLARALARMRGDEDER
jgi:2-aminoadipate transaminase